MTFDLDKTTMDAYSTYPSIPPNCSPMSMTTSNMSTNSPTPSHRNPFYHNNYESLKPHQESQQQNYEYYNQDQNNHGRLSTDKLNFEEETVMNNSRNARPPGSAQPPFRIRRISGEITPPNFYSNYDYEGQQQKRAVTPRGNLPYTANPQSAAVVRQLRDKFNVIDKNTSNNSNISCNSNSNGGAQGIPNLGSRTSSEFNNVSAGGAKIPPTYGALSPDQGERERGSSGGTATTAENDSATSNIWSHWLQGRLPLLILVILFLLCLFLALSGALVYFKYVPSSKFRRLPSSDEPCESTQCAFGATCRVEGGRATCRCPENCAAGYTPVCGYDDVTYGNECLLRKYMCQHQKIVQIRHHGECNEPDPCEDKACLYGSTCVPSTNGLYATCECPTSCPNYGDTEESIPVCGSDGKMHKNTCELNRLACRLGKTLTVKYAGKCDPCLGISCPGSQICHLDEERIPSCHCGEVCSLSDFNPVCGSDGKTYSNECMMRQEGCRSRRELRIIYRGKCSSGVNPCESRTCRGYETCAINRFGIAQCTCAMVCDPVVSPVCGSDGKTYDNECQLTLSSCRDSKFVSVAYKGHCDIGSACSSHNCTPGATCFERNGEPICECPVCPTDYAPVCGSDGQTHQNECHLHLKACESTTSHSTTTIQVMHSGVCNGCEKHHCGFYSVCEVGPSGKASCECPAECSPETILTIGPVCGTDGITYTDECLLQKSSCSAQKLIAVASKGHCDECANVHCKFGAKCESGICVCPTECPMSTEPVCGSNLVTYTNECELRKAACRLGRPLNVHFYGDCSEGLPGPFSGPAAGIGIGQEFKTINEGTLSGFSSSVNANAHAKGVSPPKSATNQCESIRCDFDALCELDEEGFPRCTCQFNCTLAKSNPICASDLKLYKNECEMQREACQRQTELRPRPMELCEEIEIKPCYGDEPLRNEETGNEISCGNGPSRANCPQGSFCHRTSSFAKCCRKFQDSRTLTTLTKTTTTTSTTTSKPGAGRSGPSSSLEEELLSRQDSCRDSLYGCCGDEMTAALGPNYEGCPPPPCLCNKLGSLTGKCDPVTLTCHCRSGVGGDLCDRCLPGFWGLSRILQRENEGCMACGCSKFGSVREDCEQMTGRCVCKPGTLGHKCDSCADGEFLGPLGCTIDTTSNANVRSCAELECSFGAICEQEGNRAGCTCSNILCDNRFDNQEVCASDGFTYQSECHVQLQSCRSQIGIFVIKNSPCFETSGTGTEGPVVRKWTGGLQNTEPGDDMKNESDGGQMALVSSAMKSTRHLPPMSHFHSSSNNLYSYKRVPSGHRFPTSATIQLRSYLGDSCQGDSECVSTASTCRNGRCVCREGFYEDSERIQCKPVHSHLPGTTTCSRILCDPTSTCYDHLNGSYVCTCPLRTSNLAGLGCIEKEPPIPFFSGKSRFILGKLAGYHKLSIEVEITPFLDYAHGIIIFSSQHANATGDFVSLALIDGFVEFRYDLGDGPVILKSSTRITSGSTNEIVAKRYNRDGLLRVNEDEEIVGTSPGTMKSLNLENGGYIGHVPLNSSRVWDLVGTSNGFIGCLHKLKIGRRQIEFDEDKDPLIRSIQNTHQCPSARSIKFPSNAHSHHGHGMTTTPIYTIVEELGGEDEEQENEIIPVVTLPTSTERIQPTISPKTACARKNCRNQGECWVDQSAKSGHRCVCSPEYSGKSCEIYEKKLVESGAVLDFRGFTYLELPKIETGARHLTMELWVMLRSRNGLLVYSGQERGKGDCVALVVSNAHIQFLFDLGSGMANITSEKPLTLNKWHWIIASRVGREGKLQIDGLTPKTLKSPPALSELNLELPLFVGGIRDMNLVHRDLGFLRPFDGALQYVRVNGETYHREIRDALRRRLVHRNEGPPCGASISPPCKNGGSCFPRLDSFACVCLSQFSGETCEIRRTVSGPVRFDGQNFLKFPRRIPKQNKAQRRNRLEIVFRTTSANSGVLLWTGREYFGRTELKRGYMGVFLSEGFLELRIDLGAPKNKKPVILRSKVNVTDGRWHQVLIARRRRLIVFQVDGSTPQRATAPMGSNVLFSDGKIWIGGVGPGILPNDVPPNYHQGFIGCVDLIRIEKRRLPLSKVALDKGFAFCDDDD